MKTLGFLLLICVMSSCKKYSEDVMSALLLAGENKNELVEVLEYYRKEDKQKYEAACFLVTNMPYHNTAADTIPIHEHHLFFHEENLEYQNVLKSISIDDVSLSKLRQYDSIRNIYAAKFVSLPAPMIETFANDIQKLSGNFLKEHIDACFEQFRMNPLLKELSFEDFKELILPYRTAEESLNMSGMRMRQFWGGILENDSIRASIEQFKIYVEKMRWLNGRIKNNMHLGMYDLLMPKFEKDCFNITTWTCDIFRANGVPVVLEYTPQYRDRIRRHYWCASPDSNGIVVPYTVPDNNLLEDWERALQYAGKVFRLSFGVNKQSPVFIAAESEYIPKALNSALIHDVTWRYHQTVTLKLPFDSITSNHLAYLCFFAGDKLQPVAWGKINRNAVVFEQVPVNTLFFPAYYVGQTLQPFGEPFMLVADRRVIDIPLPFTKKEKYREPIVTPRSTSVLGLFYYGIGERNGKETITLLRKYPEKREMKGLRNRMQGGCIVASNCLNGPFDTLFVLKQVPYPYLQRFKLHNEKKYRYYKYESPINYRHANIAHLEFLGEFSSNHVCIPPTTLPIFPVEEGNLHDEKLFKIVGKVLRYWSKPENAFDGDWETYVPASRVGMDFGNPVHISHINLLPRNANNMIVVGDTYQLLYYHYGWRVHNTIVADKNFLLFEDVPSNMLYWLRNLSNGEEELPFFYNKDWGQIFIHEISEYQGLFTRKS